MKKGQNISLLLFFDVFHYLIAIKVNFQFQDSFNTAQCISQINV